MKKFIITISREFGCNAREVARKAAAELGVEFYDTVSYTHLTLPTT